MGTFGNALQGGMGGLAATGGNPIGGLVGAGLGIFGGMFGGSQPGSQQYDALVALANEAQNRQAPQWGVQQAGTSGFRQNQVSLMNQLQALANGQGPSLATQMLHDQGQNAAQNQFAQAAAARGNPALANRQATNNAAGIYGQAAQQAAQARTAEQLGALSQLGGVIGQGRGQDQNLNMYNTSQLNDNARAQAMAQLQFWAQNDASRLASLQGAYGVQQGMSQQPSIGDYLMAFGGGLGQMRAQAKQGAMSPMAGIGDVAAGVGQRIS